jgi:hypothetical protein
VFGPHFPEFLSLSAERSLGSLKQLQVGPLHITDIPCFWQIVPQASLPAGVLTLHGKVLRSFSGEFSGINNQNT